MSSALLRALELVQQIEDFPLGKCGPSDDPDMQTAYLYSFLDLTTPFLAAAKRIGDPDLSELIANLNPNVGYITEAYVFKAELQGVIDYLKEASQYANYGQSVKTNSAFLDQQTLLHLKLLNSSKFDMAKLIRFCEELNDNYGRGNYLSCVLIIRAVMNHIPPIFGEQTFSQVVSQSGRSLKSILERLEDGARPIADLHTHMLIRPKESLPTKHQVEPYKASFEILIQEMANRLQP